MYARPKFGFDALVWENTIWLSNGAQIPIKDVIIDSVTGRVYRTVSGDDRKANSTDPYRWTSGHTVDITDLLTFDERNALRASAKAFDLGSKAPSPGVSPVGWAALAGVAVLVTIFISTR